MHSCFTHVPSSHSTMASDARFDDIFMTLVSTHRDLPDVLATFFGWLHRRTDFFVVDPNPKRAIGFAAGDAERIVRGARRPRNRGAGSRTPPPLPRSCCVHFTRTPLKRHHLRTRRGHWRCPM